MGISARFHLLRCKESTAHGTSGRGKQGADRRWAFVFPMRCCSCAGGHTEQRQRNESWGWGEMELGQPFPIYLFIWERKWGVFLLKIFTVVNSHFLTEECFYMNYMSAFTWGHFVNEKNVLFWKGTDASRLKPESVCRACGLLSYRLEQNDPFMTQETARATKNHLVSVIKWNAFIKPLRCI